MRPSEGTRENDPLVSIVLLTYNRATILPNAIDSVLNQSYPRFELLIVDDHSTDYTDEIIEQYDDPRIRYHRHDSNRGEAATRNTGVELATGEFVAFLDDDDEYLPEFLQKSVQRITNQPENCAGTFVAFEVRRHGGPCTVRHVDRIVEGLNSRSLRQRRIGGTMLRREVFDEVGGFDESLTGVVDLDLWIRILRSRSLAGIDEPLYRYNKHGEQITEYTELSTAGFERLLEKHPDLPADFQASLRYTCGHAYAAGGDMTRSMTQFLRMFHLTPSSPRASFYLTFSMLGLLGGTKLFKVGRSLTDLKNGKFENIARRGRRFARYNGWQALAKLDAFTGFSERLSDRTNRVVSYHSVDGSNFGSISQTRFRQDLAHIDETYEIVDLPEIFAESSDKKKVALTFDDAFDDFYENALPILREFDAPATVFVIAQTLDNPDFSHDRGSSYRYMAEDQLLELVDDELVTIGNHTRSHPDLGTIHEREILQTEILDAQDILENRLGTEIRRFSYPYCSYNRESLEVVRASHDMAVIGQEWPEMLSPPTDLHRIPRVPAHRSQSRYLWDLTDSAARVATIAGGINRSEPSKVHSFEHN